VSYVAWAVLAMITYGVSTFMLKYVFRTVSPAAGLMIANLFVVFAGAGWMFLQGRDSLKELGWNGVTALLLLAGVVLAMSIVSFYKALSIGPATVVVPIFALSFAVVALLGFTILGEPIKPTRVVGIVLAASAIVLLTR
jgi:transporter family protein